MSNSELPQIVSIPSLWPSSGLAMHNCSSLRIMRTVSPLIPWGSWIEWGVIFICACVYYVSSFIQFWICFRTKARDKTTTQRFPSSSFEINGFKINKSKAANVLTGSDIALRFRHGVLGSMSPVPLARIRVCHPVLTVSNMFENENRFQDNSLEEQND